MSYFNKRRTIRRYSSREVSQELLKNLLEQAAHAPTTGNMQLYSVIVTRDQEMKKLLAPAHFGQPQVTGCSVLLTFCADFNRFVKWCEQRNAVPGYDNLQSLITAVLDTVIFAQQFNTVAELNGLGCCYLGTTTYNAPDIAKVLSLPERVVPVVTLAVGYPDGEGREDGRLPVDAVIHNEKYHDYTPEDIDRLYAEKEAREDSAAYVKENGKDTLAQVFTDVRYTRESNEAFSKVLKDFLSKNYPGL
ncbi:MAG: nitroreductase family protein [Muribaculaceae bacterium]|nr:nitroreductase family protein [Muribaculaceae bacterium]